MTSAIFITQSIPLLLLDCSRNGGKASNDVLFRNSKRKQLIVVDYLATNT